MPTPQHHTFTDAHGVIIHYYVWAADEPRAVLQLAHGLGEYAVRYQALADQLAAAGISVWAHDNRGHGKTGVEQFGGDLSKLGRPGPGGLRAEVDVIHQFTGIIRAANPGLPLAYLGHSWGSILGQILLNDHADDFDAVVLSGTAYRMPGHMNAGDLNARHKHLGDTGYEWLSRDTAVAAAVAQDELFFHAEVMKLFGVVDALKVFGRPTRLAKDLPMLILIGSEDPLGGEVSVRKLAEAYIERGGLSDVEVVVYQEGRHEMFNETNQQEVRDDVQGWLTERLGLAVEG